MSERDQQKREECHTRIFNCVCLLFVIIAIVMLIIIYLQSKEPLPSFTLDNVKIYAFNVSTETSTLTSNFQITLVSNNEDCSNDRIPVQFWHGNTHCFNSIGFHYDNIDVYASYKKQQITLPTMLPPSFQNSYTTWIPYLNGTDFALSPELAISLAEDMTAGGMLIDIVVKGHMSTKSIFFKVRSQLKVTCMAYIMFGNNIKDTSMVGYLDRNPLVERCHVDVGLAV